jgi:hypothetical protein
MAKNPSTRWYFNDWRNDTAVMACSDAAQGFWAWLLCICAENGGYLLIGGRAPTVAELATLRGRDKRTIVRLLAELRAKNVFSVREDGTIFNRRMVRDFEANRAKSRTRAGDSARSRDGEAQDSLPLSDPLPSPEAAREGEAEGLNNEKRNPEGGRCAPLGRIGESIAKPAKPSSSATDYRDSALTCKCRSGGPAGTCDRSFDGQTSEVPVHHYPILGCTRQDRDGALNGEGQPATVGLPRRGRAPPRPAKSPALKAKIREQLVQKHARYLMARRRPEHLAAYWTAQLGDDKAEAQRVFDAVDRRMRCENWDDMREWRGANLKAT